MGFKAPLKRAKYSLGLDFMWPVIEPFSHSFQVGDIVAFRNVPNLQICFFPTRLLIISDRLALSSCYQFVC